MKPLSPNAQASTHPPADAPPTCPACASARVIPVVYGSPTTETLAAYAAGRLSLGGVRKSPGGVVWRCRDCDRAWDDGAPGPGTDIPK